MQNKSSCASSGHVISWKSPPLPGDPGHDSIDNFGGCCTAVFTWFTYDEVGAFRHEALNTVQRLRQRWMMARGAIPIADMIEILDSFPTPGS